MARLFREWRLIRIGAKAADHGPRGARHLDRGGRLSAFAFASGTKTLRAALHGRPRGESVFERLDDPDRFRADLLRLIEALESADAPSERPGPAS